MFSEELCEMCKASSFMVLIFSTVQLKLKVQEYCVKGMSLLFLELSLDAEKYTIFLSFVAHRNWSDVFSRLWLEETSQGSSVPTRQLKGGLSQGSAWSPVLYKGDWDLEILFSRLSKKKMRRWAFVILDAILHISLCKYMTSKISLCWLFH